MTSIADAVDPLVATAPNKCVIDLAAVRDNARALKGSIGEDCRLIAALKGNAYGHGLIEAAGAALDGGADGLSMVHLRDAIRVRRAGVTAPILLYCGNLGDAPSVELVERYDLTTTIVDRDSLELYATRATRPVKAFLKVDVGIERLGCRPEAAVELAQAILAAPNLELEGVYTHLDADGQYAGQPLDAGSSVHPYIQWQYDRFEAVLGDLAAAGIDPKVKLASSSPTVKLTAAMNLNAVDVGRLLFGLSPEVPENVALNLRPAFAALTSRVLQVKPVDRTEFTEWPDFEVRPGMTVGVIPMGYGDGLAVLSVDEALVRGRRVPIIGKHFEHGRLDLTGVPDAQPGDEVVIIGRQGSEEITLQDVAVHHSYFKAAGLASLVRESVPKVYVNA